jgi:hypothetical protein
MTDSRPQPPLKLQADALLKALNDHDVEYVVIGGYALSAHWATRATKDVDIVPDPDPANLDRLWTALASIDASPLPLVDFGAEEMPLEWSRDSFDFGGNWLLATRHGRLDILQYVEGVDGYRPLREHAVDLLDDVAGRIWFAGRDDLISMKRAAGRPQDLEDIARIEREASRYE